MLISSAILFYGLLRWKKVFFIKNNILILFCLIFVITLIFSPKTSFDAALYGINLWLNVVFPSLFPFFIVSEFLSKTGFIKYIGIILEPIMRPLFNVPGCGSFALSMGIISGYPVGAKITANMRENHLLTKTEAERLISFTNNSGPLFIIGAVAVGIFKAPQIGIFLWIFHVLASITVGIIFKFYRKKNDYPKNYSFKNIILSLKKEYSLQRNSALGFGDLLENAIKNSISTMLTIGGFIILFSVIISILLNLKIINLVSNFISLFLTFIEPNKELFRSILSGLFEITSGVNMVSQIHGDSDIIKLTAVAFLIGWAGLSVHFQVLSIISKTDINPKPYLAGKFLQALFQCAYTFIGLKFICF